MSGSFEPQCTNNRSSGQKTGNNGKRSRPIDDLVVMQVLEAEHDTAGVEHAPRLTEHVRVNVHHQVSSTCELHHKDRMLLNAHKTAAAYTHTHTQLMALCPGLPGSAGIRKAKPVWISLKQDTVSGSGISSAICKSAPRSRQITTPAPHHSRKARK